MDLLDTLVLVLAFVCSSVHGYTVKLVVVNREAPLDSGITCWTCPNKTDNEACNNWAPDIKCPFGHGWCRTVHRINSITGESIFVDKQCVMESECSEDIVGCHDTDIFGVQDCITCCNEDYCNELVPSNHSSAHMQSSYYGNSAATSTTMTTSYLTLLSIVFISILTCSWCQS